MVDRSPLPCDANCLNAHKNGSARAAASRAAADLVAEPPQLLPTRDPEEPSFNSTEAPPALASAIAQAVQAEWLPRTNCGAGSTPAWVNYVAPRARRGLGKTRP